MEVAKHAFVALTVAGLLSGVALGCYGPMAGDDAALLQIPTIAAIGLLVAAFWRGWLSSASFAFVAAFLGLHTLASYYGYCNVPYDDWLERLAGLRTAELVSSDRNHFDRLLHFCYGLLLWLPTRELVERFLGIRDGRASWVALEFILASSAVYEIAEWLLAVFMAPEIADRYNGQQGDIWDAQKDMALAGCGVILAAVLFRIPEWLRRLRAFGCGGNLVHFLQIP
jgi:putative membrane protein